MKSTVMYAVVICLTQFIFSISIGAICSIFYRNYIGILIILGLLIFNFFNYNPLIYDSAYHFISFSEQLYNVHRLNLINLFSLWIITIVNFIGIFIINNAIEKLRTIKLFFLLISMLIFYVLNIGLDFNTFDKHITNNNYNVVYDGENQIKYNDVDIKEVEFIYFISNSFANAYYALDTSFVYEDYYISKIFMSKISWELKKIQPQVFILDNKKITINIISPSVLNFSDTDMIINLMDECKNSMVLKIKGYNDNKYIKKLVEGYSIVIIRDVSKNMHEIKSIKLASEVFNYYENYMDKVFDSQINKNNYIYKLALIIYEDYPQYSSEIYIKLQQMKPDNDDEFIEFLYTHYNEVYKDEKILDILKEIGYEYN